MRPVNFDVTGRAITVLRVLVMLRSTRLNGSDVMCDAVACQAELVNCAEPQQPRIRRAVWRMTGHATFSLHRGVFISKRTLLIRVTFNASGIAAGGQSCLFEFKTAMRVMTITAAHRAFHDFMMEGRGERRFDFAVTTQAKLRVTHFQHLDCREAWLFGVYCGHPSDRAGHVLIGCD